MSESKHTKGKLVVSSSFLVVTEETCRIVANTQPIGVEGITTTFAEGKANAERIIKCWNSHDTLLDACEWSLKVLNLFSYEKQTQDIRDNLKAAIAEAEKQA